ncbi:MAG TPA: outer membrane beta-barrel protein [Pseudolabrys sp.]|nr:outer membrane beta-barrel protein [Pseudolabrys sp.]
MKPYLLSTVSALAISGAASAADMPLKAPMVPSAPGWTGLYLGAHGGVAWLDASQAVTGPINITTCSTVPGARCDVDTTGAIFGGQVGYNWQSQNWVFGIEADASGTSLKKTQNVSPTVVVHNINEKVDWLASVRGRLGWAVGDTLFYGTGGVAFGHFDAGWSRPTGAARAQFDHTATGWVAGGGIEKMFSRNWSARLEFLHYGLGRSSFGSTTGGTYTTAFRHDVSAVRLGINFRP